MQLYSYKNVSINNMKRKILLPEVVSRDAEKKIKKPGQFRYCGTSGHPTLKSGNG